MERDAYSRSMTMTAERQHRWTIKKETLKIND